MKSIPMSMSEEPKLEERRQQVGKGELCKTGKGQNDDVKRCSEGNFEVYCHFTLS